MWTSFPPSSQRPSYIPHIPELAAQTLGSHLTLNDIKALRLASWAWCHSMACHPVTIRVVVPKPESGHQEFMQHSLQRSRTAYRLPNSWTRLQKVVFDWSRWNLANGDKEERHDLHKVVQDIAAACKSKGVSEVHLEGCPNLCPRNCSILLLYLAPIRVHFMQFKPPSLWSSSETAAQQVKDSWFKGCQGGFAGVSCLLRDEEDLWTSQCTEALPKLEDLQSLQLYVDLDLHEAKKIYQDNPPPIANFFESYSGLQSLSTLVAVTSLTVHTLPRIYPSNALEGLGAPGEEDGKYLCILRGIRPCFYASHLDQLSSLQHLRSLSLDLLVADNEDEYPPGQSLAQTSSARFLSRLPVLQHLTLRMHCQKGLKGVVEVLSKTTHLKSLHLILLHHALGEDQVPWQENSILMHYEVEELSFLTQLTALTSTELKLEQRCFWSRARYPEKEISDYKAATFQMIPTVDTTGEERVLCLPCFPVWSAMAAGNVVSLSVHDANYYSNDLVELAKMTSLRSLTLTGVYVTGEKMSALSYLSALNQLTQLHVGFVDEFYQMNSNTQEQECCTLTFSNCLALTFSRSLTRLRSLELQMVDTDCLTSRGMLTLMRACSQLTRLVINERDHSHLARRCSTIMPPMTEAKFSELLEGLLAPELVSKVRVLKQVHELDGQPQQYTMMLGYLISKKDAQDELLGLAATEVVEKLLSWRELVLGQDGLYRRILMLL